MNKNKTEKVTSKSPVNKKVSKDELMNTPKEVGNEVKLMPYDEETLKIFTLKKWNFKDMTGNQKTIMIVICILFLALFLLLILPTLSSLFGGINIGNLHFFNQKEKEKEKEKDAFMFEGDYITLGRNISVTVSDIKFNNFTKSSDYKLIFNYLSKKDITNVAEEKLYIEVYSNSKSLLSRFLFDPEKELKTGDSGIYSVKLSSNNFNKAQFIVIRVIKNILDEELPDDIEEPGDPVNPDPNENPGNEEPDPNKNDKNLLKCTISNIDGSLKINKNLNATFKDDKITTYTISYTITSLIDIVPKNYSSNYKKMMNLYKDLMSSPGCSADIKDHGFTAELNYTVVLKDYKDIVIKEEYLDSYDEEYLKQKTPYQLEIEKDSKKSNASSLLEASDWICD